MLGQVATPRLTSWDRQTVFHTILPTAHGGRGSLLCPLCPRAYGRTVRDLVLLPCSGGVQRGCLAGGSIRVSWTGVPVPGFLNGERPGALSPPMGAPVQDGSSPVRCGCCAKAKPSSSHLALLLPRVYPLTGQPAVGLQTMACLFAVAGEACTGPWHSHQSSMIKSIREGICANKEAGAEAWPAAGWGALEGGHRHPPVPPGHPRVLPTPPVPPTCPEAAWSPAAQWWTSRQGGAGIPPPPPHPHSRCSSGSRERFVSFSPSEQVLCEVVKQASVCWVSVAVGDSVPVSRRAAWTPALVPHPSGGLQPRLRLGLLNVLGLCRGACARSPGGGGLCGNPAMTRVLGAGPTPVEGSRGQGCLKSRGPWTVRWSPAP